MSESEKPVVLTPEDETVSALTLMVALIATLILAALVAILVLRIINKPSNR